MTAEATATDRTDTAHTVDDAAQVAIQDAQSAIALTTLVEQVRDTLDIVEMLLYAISGRHQDTVMSADTQAWRQAFLEWRAPDDLAGIVELFRANGALTDRDITVSGILDGKVVDW